MKAQQLAQCARSYTEKDNEGISKGDGAREVDLIKLKYINMEN